MKKRTLVAFGVAILLIALFVIVVGWEDVLAAVARADLAVYALAVASCAVTLCCRGAAWHSVFNAVEAVSARVIAGLFLTSMFVKYVMPYGQIASGPGVAAIVPQYTPLAYEESLAAVVSGDFVNYLPYYTFGAVGVGYFFLTRSPRFDVGLYAAPVAGLVLVVVGFLAVLWFRRDLVERMLMGAVGGLRRLVALVSERHAAAISHEGVRTRLEGFYATLELVSRDRTAVAVAVVFAHLGWLGLAASLYFTADALGTPIPFGIAILGVVLSKVGFVTPAPGGLGGVELTLATILFLLTGMSGATATAVAILYRFATYWFTVLVGGAASIWMAMYRPGPTEE